MTIEVIPNNTNVVVSDNCTRDLTLMSTVKDTEADLERSGGLHYGDTVKTIKDAEANLERSGGTRYGNTLEVIRDAECNLDRLAANRFAQTIEEIKENETAVEKAHGVTRDIVRQSEIATESAKAKIIDTIRKAEIHTEKSEDHTRALMAAGYADLKNSIFNTEKELGYSVLQGFKDQQMVSYQLAATADKTACNNAAVIQLGFAVADKDRAIHATANALAFKEVELRQERLAAMVSKEAATHHCELKELIRDDGQRTRDLIVNNDTERLRERARRTESALSAYFSRNVPPMTPTG